MNKLLSLVNYAPLRMGVALGYTIFVVIILVQPNRAPVIDLHLAVETPSLMNQLWFGVGHALLFAVMSLAGCFSFCHRLPLRAALTLAFSVALIVGVGTEIGQLIVSARDPSLFDVAMDFVGASLPMLALWLLFRGKQDSLQPLCFDRHNDTLKVSPTD
jgi:VanZ family protein